MQDECQLTLSGNRELFAREGDFCFQRWITGPSSSLGEGGSVGVGSAESADPSRPLLKAVRKGK